MFLRDSRRARMRFRTIVSGAVGYCLQRRVGASVAFLAGALALWLPLASASAQDQALPGAAKPWSEKDTRLATEYLSLLVEKPEYGRVLDLLWELYDKQGQTDFLLESISAQAKANPHPHVQLVHGHLLRKSGKVKDAAKIYQQVLSADPKQWIALRGLADLHLDQQQRVEALPYLKRLIEALPPGDLQRIPLLEEQGKVLLELDRPAEAVASWEAAVQLQPENATLVRHISQLMLGAGQLDKALKLCLQLTKTNDPALKLDALYDLARLEEQAEHFSQAVRALRDGLNLLHYKDWRYGQFFQKLVKLHERFDQLDLLKSQLTRAAETKPVSEKALLDLVTFSALTVDTDERVHWLEEMVRAFPQAQEHRWSLVSALLDHGESARAAQLLDEVLKQDGSDPVALVVFRALADIRSQAPDKALARLRQILAAQGTDPEVEKRLLSFARENSLDKLTEEILKARWQRQPDRAEALFDLAGFYRARGRTRDMEQVFAAYTEVSDATVRLRRLNEVGSFLGSGSDPAAAELIARQAVDQSQSGRDEVLRLADVLAQKGDLQEARQLLEKAWTQSTTPEARVDVDERLLSLLLGDRQRTPASASEYVPPDIFSGAGFGSDAVVMKPESAPEGIVRYAREQLFAVIAGRIALPDALSVPLVLRGMSPDLRLSLSRIPPPTPERVLRAAWWSLRAEDADAAYFLLRSLKLGPDGLNPQVPVEVDRLMLDLALLERDKNPPLAIRLLRQLSVSDPTNRTSYLMRLAEMEAANEAQYRKAMPEGGTRDRVAKRGNRSLPGTGLAEAIRILQGLLKESPQSEAVISTLSQYLMEDGQRDEALALWERVVKESQGNAAPLLERYADLLMARSQHKKYCEVQVQMLQRETDVKRRREIFQRALDRLLWTDSSQGALTETEQRRRLDLLAPLLQDMARKQPFEGFWQECLAGVYSRNGDPVKAFAAMKQAYYSAPDTPFSLDQLRAAAMRVGDLKSAIYFQKQIAVTAAVKDEPGEWRKLVQLLESDFRVEEADQARLRLEARYSQDAAALAEFAKYYSETGQDDAARRVWEQLARVRSWDAKNLFHLAMQQKRMGEKSSAAQTLEKLLQGTPMRETTKGTPAEKWPWPLFDEREGAAMSPAVLLGTLESATSPSQQDRDDLRVFLSLPRGEFSEFPEEVEQIRLRAVEELAKLSGKAPVHLPLSLMEQAWARYYGGQGLEFRKILQTHLAKASSIEADYLRVWLGVRSHGMGEVLAWTGQAGLNELTLKRRRALFALCIGMLVEDESFALNEDDLTQLATSVVLSRGDLTEICRRLESRRSYTQALFLAEAASQAAGESSLAQLLYMSRLAAVVGDSERERQYLYRAWEQPILADRPQQFDGFAQSLARLWKLTKTPAERERLMTESWRRMQQTPASGQGYLRQIRVLGAIGATDLSAELMGRYLGNGFVAARAFADQPRGRSFFTPGQSGGSVDEMNQMRHYWEDLQQWADAMKSEGLTEEVVKAEAWVDLRNGGVAIGPRSSYEYNSWRWNKLVSQLRFTSYAERIRLVREAMMIEHEWEILVELGAMLERSGYLRESIEVYRTLPARAPVNNDYAEQLFRACEGALDGTAAIPYIEKLLISEAGQKPQGISEETLRDKHARYLAWNYDVPRLQELAYRKTPTPRVIPGRAPTDAPYLRELAALLEKRGDKPGALAALEELHRLWKEDIESSVRRARLLHEQGNDQRALEALRATPLWQDGPWGEPVLEGFTLLAELSAKAGQWEVVRDLMSFVSGGVSAPSRLGDGGRGPAKVTPTVWSGFTLPAKTQRTANTSGVLALSRILAKYNRPQWATSLLVSAERSVKDEGERFRLRLAQLQIVAQNPSWQPGKDRPRLAALLRGESEDAVVVHELISFLQGEASGARSTGWVQTLLTLPASPMRSLVLGAFASQLQEQQASSLVDPWRGADTQELAVLIRNQLVEELLRLKRPGWAAAVLDAGVSGKSLSSQKITVLAALGDRYGVEEIFGEVVRAPVQSDGSQTLYAEALVAAGRPDLADEVFSSALGQIRSRAEYDYALVLSYADFLISQKHYEKAETLLLAECGNMTEGLPEILVKLYRGWNKLDQIPVELAKFSLSAGVFHETMHLAALPKVVP